MAETTITKLATEIVHHESCPGSYLILGQKIKFTGSQSAKTYFKLEGNRVAGVSLHSIEWPASSYVCVYMRNILNVCRPILN